ncbi:NnrU family protein [Craurococcus roseus]|uniref:NnrU family protein n=1 Tax=Craurococcus roseus TaxID=77585 RepID=A0ABN1EJQ8_9PROT
MGGWGELFVAFAAFLLSHALPARPALRRPLAAALGERGYLLTYSLVSLAALAWLIAAAGRAPYVALWGPAPWQAWVPNLAMPAACLLVAFGLGAPNPLSFGGRADGFDPERPGVAGVSRHPLLLALALWAGAHAVANGDLAHVALFGAFAGFALLGMRIIDRRKRRLIGAGEWNRLAARTSGWPLAALVDGRWRPSALPEPWRLGLGLLLWLALLALHAPVVGVSPLPPG